MYETENSKGSTRDLQGGEVLLDCIFRNGRCVLDKLDVNNLVKPKILFSRESHEVTHGRLYDCSMSKRINLHPKYMFQNDFSCHNSIERKNQKAVVSGCTLTAHYMVRSYFKHKRKRKGSQKKNTLLCFLVLLLYYVSLKNVCKFMSSLSVVEEKIPPYLGDEQTCC